MVLKLPRCHEDSEYVLSLKLDNGKVVSIAHEQTHRQMDIHPHYRISIGKICCASLLKFSGRNSIAQFLTKTYIIHFAYFRVVLDLSLSDNLLFGMRNFSIFELILGFAYAYIHI